jgi:hypothetical protein
LCSTSTYTINSSIFESYEAQSFFTASKSVFGSCGAGRFGNHNCRPSMVTIPPHLHPVSQQYCLMASRPLNLRRSTRSSSKRSSQSSADNNITDEPDTTSTSATSEPASNGDSANRDAVRSKRGHLATTRISKPQPQPQPQPLTIINVEEQTSQENAPRSRSTTVYSQRDTRQKGDATKLDPHDGRCLLTQTVNPHFASQSMVEGAHLLRHAIPEAEVRLSLRLCPCLYPSPVTHLFFLSPVYR